MQLRIEYLKINDLKPYERNTRKHEEHEYTGRKAVLISEKKGGN